MLELLRIHNLALIEDMEMEFSRGMNVLTGETGAGKSFILKALSFVTGEKLGAELVRPGKEKAVVEALFVQNGEDLIIRRELAADTGRSRLYINDHLSSLEAARELRASLLVHTSQHGQQKLLVPSFQAAMLDDFMSQPALLEEKNRLVKALANIIQQRDTLEKNAITLAEKRDILEYQQQEIAKVAPYAGEEEALEEQRIAARTQEDRSKSAHAALAALLGEEDNSGLFDNLRNLEKAVSRLAPPDSDDNDGLAHALDTVLDITSRLSDLEKALRKIARETAQDIDTEAIEARLYALAQLKRKLKRELPAILSLQQEIEENLSFLDSCGLERKQLARQEAELCDTLAACLVKVNAARAAAALTFAEALQEELRALGFSEHTRVQFAFTPHALHPKRQDCAENRARLLWMPNPGQAPQPLDHIASGGELSRFLLAVISILSSKSTDDPVLIFDEVDSGVGGLTLNRVASRLESLAKVRQTLLITHWPQLAARANRHFFIQKEVVDGQTYTTCKPLADAAIADELTRMAGGGKEGAAFAQELL